ncbi:restriction endonuclease [Streptomyces spiramenti]|uniref:restriction endonuclease n=1 Tax=Streptomyces spiramenti TaxID=2720606 RepID=UPI00308446D7
MKGRGKKAVRRRNRRAAVAAAAVVGGVVLLFWERLWPFVAAAAVVGAAGAGAWWAWRTHRRLRTGDARWRHQDRLAVSHRSVATVDGMDETEFEHLTAGLLRRDGCTGVERIGGSGDRGVDVLGRLPDGRRLIVQCKRYAPGRSVTSPDIIRLVGSTVHYGAEIAMVVTTTRLTGPAVKDAARHDVVTISRDHLGHWLNGASLSALMQVSEGGHGARGHLGRWNNTYGRRPGRRRSDARPRSGRDQGR